MQVELFSGDWLSESANAMIVTVDDRWKDDPRIQALSERTQGWLTRLLRDEDISTAAGKVTTLPAPPNLPVQLLVMVGLGSKEKRNAGVIFRSASAAMKSAASKARDTLRFIGFDGMPLDERTAVCGAMHGCVGQDLFKKEKSLFPPNRLQFVGLSQDSIARASVIGESTSIVRRLVNLPPNYIYPESFVDEVRQVADECGLELTVWDQSKLEQERCGSLLGVAVGSVREPRLAILSYRGAGDEAPIALVGKGVTFDSGGYSLKPSDSMLTMKCDMAGAATVLGIIRAAAKLKVKKNLVAIFGLVENMVSGAAFKLGDVLTARSGKTIEIHNTDAEGRLVLADCLNVALDYKPSHIVDFATLTGACVVGLGNDIAGLMTNNQDWQSAIQRKADECGEYTWPLPMHSFFSELIAGKIADIKNVGEGRWGGAITAAKFLEEFVDGKPWTHVDIAGPAFLDSAKPWSDAGGSGCLVRTFAELLSS